MLHLNAKYLAAIVPLIISSLYVIPAWAGFLEMPDVTDVPEMERRTMLRDLDIPGVRDRNPDPQAGPRLAVSAFRLQGMVEFPELGITKAELDKMVEEIRVDLMAEGKLLDSGFTQEELGEVSDLLVKIEEETMDRHVSTLEVQQLVWLVRDQRSKRGITLGQIESVADKITNFYRERGFILAKAYIPKQEVRDGIVNLTMQLGLLGEVVAVDNVLYKGTMLESTFDDVLTKPVTNNAIEERLYLINDYPGINVSGFFEPGSQVGDTKLNIKINQESKYDATVRLDNHGTDNTGKSRLYGELLINNPLGLVDQVNLGLLNSYDPGNTTYWQFKYKTNYLSPYWRINIGATTNQFVVDQSTSSLLQVFELEGMTEQKYISTNYTLQRGRKQNFSIELEYESILSDLSLGTIRSISERLDDEIKNTSVAFYFDVLDEVDRILHQGSVTVTAGEFLKGVEVNQDDKFNILSTDYTLLTFWKIPYIESNTRIIFRATAQFSDNPLSSLSQFSLGGPNRTRAYPIDQFSADTGIYSGLEWVFNIPDIFDFGLFSDVRFGKITQPFFFLDAAYGINKTLDLTNDDATASLLGAGLGFKFAYLNAFKGNLQFAFPIKHKFENSNIVDIDDSMKVVFDFQYSFL